MAIRAISSHTQERITIAYKASAAADAAVTQGASKISIALESLAADGFTRSTDFISPTKVASSCSPEEWDALKVVIRAGMSKEDRALMDAPKGSLSPAKQNQRTKAHQKINSFIGKLKKAAAAAERKRDGKPAVTFNEQLHKDIATVLNRLSKAEEASFDVTKCSSLIQQALDMIR